MSWYCAEKTNNRFITQYAQWHCLLSYGSFLTEIWAWRDLVKNKLKQFIMQDLAAQNSGWMMLSAFGSLIKIYSHYPHWKFNIITDFMNPLHQRRKTAKQNAFFAQEWRSVSGCQRVKIGPDWFDNNRSLSRNQLNLLLSQCTDHASFWN